VRGSEPLPTVGTPAPPLVDTRALEVDAMLESFRLGVRDLGGIWDLILAPDTLGELLVLENTAGPGFRFRDDLWVRIVYDFALGHHYGVVHRDHLLRSLVPLYLGRTAAYVQATRTASAQATEQMLEETAVTFERQKPYLVEHWR